MTTAPDHHPDDELVDLALGHVTGERRTELARHLLACPRCRHEYEGLIGSVEAVAAAAPAVQPPLGFDQRTLARMGVGEPPAAAPVARPARRWLPAAAAAAVVALALAAGGGALWAGRDDPGGADRVAALTTGAGRDVGTATVTEVAGEPVLVVGLTVGVEGATYTCRMRFADGSTVDTDPWSAAPGAGWLVPLPDDRGPLTGIELLAPDHGAWSTADLDG
ncbi:MAG TPA: hypothetical protein VK507_01400 [Iamia sp.]|nr:hypothetical protein [Iamia sp.]